MQRTPPGQLPDPDMLAEALVVFFERKAELSRRLGFQLTMSRALILLLAFVRPVYAKDVSRAVWSLEGSPLYPMFCRMRYKGAAYRILSRLAADGWMERVHTRRGRPVPFRLSRSVRGKLERVFDKTRDGSGRPIWPPATAGHEQTDVPE